MLRGRPRFLRELLEGPDPLCAFILDVQVISPVLESGHLIFELQWLDQRGRPIGHPTSGRGYFYPSILF